MRSTVTDWLPIVTVTWLPPAEETFTSWAAATEAGSSVMPVNPSDWILSPAATAPVPVSLLPAPIAPAVITEWAVASCCTLNDAPTARGVGLGGSTRRRGV